MTRGTQNFRATRLRHTPPDPKLLCLLASGLQSRRGPDAVKRTNPDRIGSLATEIPEKVPNSHLRPYQGEGHPSRTGLSPRLARRCQSSRLGYADPPYLGCAHLYRDHPDYAGEVDHPALIERLEREFDGWVLHTSATPDALALLAPLVQGTGARWMSWVKGFAAFKKNVPVAYAWEPVIIKAARKPVVSGRLIMRDWIKESITLQRGLTGAKPEAVCHWAFELLGAEPDDELVDLFPGTGAVSRSWETWKEKVSQLELLASP